jgi:hypothetical protein
MLNLSKHQIVNLLHILIVGPLLIYLWCRGVYQDKPINKDLLIAIGCLGFLTICYHGYKLYVYSQ